jgi:hypothetical protein
METYATTAAVFSSDSAICCNDSIGSQRGMMPHYEYLRAFRCHKNRKQKSRNTCDVSQV